MLRRSIAALRGESAVPTLLTLVVSAWFLAAGVAIFADRAADARPRSQPATTAAAAKGCATNVLAENPEARETILVEAPRAASVVAQAPAVRETILVEARRG